MVAGEASGDAYGGLLVQALLAANPHLEIRAWGGEEMERAGAQVTKHYRELAFMGFWEVLKNIRTIARNLTSCWNEIQSFQPDAFVGIDFPGFNLRIAAKTHASGIFSHHYISPAIWAWNAKRVHRIKRHVDRMHVAMPFELEAYKSVDMDVRFVGHPLLEVLDAQMSPSSSFPTDKPILALLPGSRKQELDHMLPIFLKVAQQKPQFQPVIAGAPGQDTEAYALAKRHGVQVVFGETRVLMQQATLGLIASGTATLEAALIGLPHIICYRTSALTYQLAKRLSRVSYIGLPNILLGKMGIQERIQKGCHEDQLAKDLSALHDGQSYTQKGWEQKGMSDELKSILGTQKASKLVAASILENL